VSPFSQDPSSGLIEAPQSRRDLLVLAQFAGLLATGWVVWTTSVSPRLAHEPLARLVKEALKHTMVAGVSSAVITLGLYLLISRSSRVDALRMALRTSATAVWFAPATILLSAMSPVALGAALVLVVSTTRLLYSQWRWIHPVSQLPVFPQERMLFELPPPPFRFRDLIPGLSASFGLQAGLVAFALGYPLLAAGFFCLSVSMLTLSTLLAGVYGVERPTSLPRSVLGVLLTVILAAGLTVGGLGFHFQGEGSGPDTQAGAPSQSKPGPLQSARELLRKLEQKDADGGPSAPVTNVYLPPAEIVEVADESFGGVILWPESNPEPKLIAPSPTSPLSWLSPVPTNPLTIPFSGQYWMFKAPNSRPPKDSYFRRTTPLALSFITTDHRALAMEARQRLGHAIDLSCCRGIEISILNSDRYPGTVALELVLIDTEARGRSQSLGRTEVASRPPRNYLGQPVLPVPEVLEFPIPTATPLHAFDEIKVIFHREGMRVDRSARISIERFVLVPRAS
jgi:hypothetical protein